MPLHPAFRRFLIWWRGELTALAPEFLRRLLGRRRARLVLPAEQALIRIVSLPLAAEENLHEVLAFEMDRFTPFKAADMVFDALIRSRDREQGRLSVLLVAAQRAVIEDLLAAAHPPPAGIAVAGAPDAIDLLPRIPARLDRLGTILALACLMLALILSALPFHRQHQRLEVLQAELDGARLAAAEADALRHDIAQGLAAERFLVEARIKRPTALAAIEELSRLVPDDAWLQQVQLSNAGIEFNGLAANAEALLRTLEDSPLFAAAAFRAPVNQDIMSGRERFALAAKWEAR